MVPVQRWGILSPPSSLVPAGAAAPNEVVVASEVVVTSEPPVQATADNASTVSPMSRRFSGRCNINPHPLSGFTPFQEGNDGDRQRPGAGKERDADCRQETHQDVPVQPPSHR